MSFLCELMLKIFMRKEEETMAVVYATLIVKQKKKTIDQVPPIIRDDVMEILEALEVKI